MEFKTGQLYKLYDPAEAEQSAEKRSNLTLLYKVEQQQDNEFRLDATPENKHSTKEDVYMFLGYLTESWASIASINFVKVTKDSKAELAKFHKRTTLLFLDGDSLWLTCCFAYHILNPQNRVVVEKVS